MSVSFRTRTEDAAKLIGIIEECVFAPCGPRLRMIPFGYETHIPEEIRTLLRFERTITARHIKFAPDFFVVDVENPEGVYLLEFKATRTPLYSSNRIRSIQRETGDPSLGWESIGQMEALAYDNYVALDGIEVRMTVLNYCAYNENPLRCDFIGNFKIVHRDVVQTAHLKGSGTPWVNYDLRCIRGLTQFISNEHRIDHDEVDSLVTDAQEALAKALPTKHHDNSPHYR